MPEKTFIVEKNNIKEIINYLQTKSTAYSGTFELEEGGEIKIRPYEGKIEIMCDCDEEMLNELGGMVNKHG